MSETCPRSFDEQLLSGYLDGELTQAEEQRVRIHLEDCRVCRDLFEQLKTMREASMSTPFATPDDKQWDERPRSGASGFFRGTGWLLIVAYAVGIMGFAVWARPHARLRVHDPLGSVGVHKAVLEAEALALRDGFRELLLQQLAVSRVNPVEQP